MNHLPFATGGALEVRRVFCVGRNYAEHAKEMGHDAREPPFFFAKSAEALTLGPEVPYPPMTSDLHHEVELVVAIGRDGADIAVDAARSHIAGYAVGIDLTRRDLQAVAKKQARPWTLAKSWIGAAPIGTLHAPSEIGHPRRGRIELKVNGAVRQSGDLADMIWSVDEIVAELSRYDRLLTGDLIMTGTPAGVAALVAGDQVEVAIEAVGQARFVIGPASS
ncbi:MAG TPA: fumarylacetoacetate hydrolase family protein [Geminicoccus sp.]|jgi:fumarylpyruvate hydrolase|uniref:fumarylacetoacetate hydrolase family protein n=1 Tax=Geminicoccus sp. TaxID=2024832 RepID=UPI002E348CAD|nr:fumarylacetoacetate hydrolase family protein [Geminicoccus sp.]HEX2526463.1 fumarylacetoacetate hydrolase family protein [Geminicoccus sp.]